MCVLDKYTGAEERLRKQGHLNLIEMGRVMDTPAQIDKALGYVGAASHWYAGRNDASRAADTAAGLWLAAHGGEVEEVAFEDDSTILMVVCPPEKTKKVVKVLGLLGCEVEEI